MKFTLAPLVSLLFGASYLIASATAYSYNDYNELDARHQIDDVLYERGFGLEARETIDVPFQPSLRAFLEEAVTAHRRSMSDSEEHLEARTDLKVTATYVKSTGNVVHEYTVSPYMTVDAFKTLSRHNQAALLDFSTSTLTAINSKTKRRRLRIQE